MATASTKSAPRTSGSSLYGLYITALAIALIGNLGIRLGVRGAWLGPSAQLAIAILSALPLAVAALLFWRLLKSDLDEMLQRVVLDGLAWALIIFVPLSALFVNLRTAGVRLPRLDPPDLLLAPAILAGLGIALAARRYR